MSSASNHAKRSHRSERRKRSVLAGFQRHAMNYQVARTGPVSRLFSRMFRTKAPERTAKQKPDPEA